MKRTPSESLQQDIDCDVLVVGGGMAGVLTAHFLQRSGRDVTLVEADQIGGKTTAKTTAVITAQHDTTYGHLIKLHGFEAARDYLRANLDAVEEYAALASAIDCDFQRRPSCMYSLKGDLSGEAEVLEKLGYSADITTKTTLPFAVESALVFKQMAQFHPLKFLFGLLGGLRIYEHTAVSGVKGHKAFTSRGTITFKQAVIATHFPFIDRAGLFFLKMHQKRSQVLALEGAPELGMTYISTARDGFYFRSYQGLLLIGKGDYRTGKKSDDLEQLKCFAREHYPAAKIRYSWANQDCVTLDDIPYVGEYGHLRDVFTLTGFNLWGMTGSMVGAKLLTDRLSGRGNPWAQTFRPSRSLLHKPLIFNLGTVVKNMIRPTVKRCPHLGCALLYNPLEHSYDCQCHGSRFDEEGHLLDDPAAKDAALLKTKKDRH